MLCVGFLSVLSAHGREPVKASWRVSGELEGAQALGSLARVTLGPAMGLGGSLTISEAQLPYSSHGRLADF